MYNKGKYIVGEINTQYGTTLTAVCFNETVPHDTFRSMFETILGAGFFGLSDQGEMMVQVYGESVSLGVKSHEDDAKQVERALGLGREYY